MTLDIPVPRTLFEHPWPDGPDMLLESLKSQTHDLHRKIEQQIELPGSEAAHVANLISFYGFIAPWEHEVAQTLSADDPIRLGREKTAWLSQDLGYFGYDAARCSGLPRCEAESLPRLQSRLQILGSAYVLEGSTLGGQFISRHLETSLGLSGGRGYLYYLSYGREVGRQWQAFRSELTRNSSPENDRVIVEAAQDTFACLSSWFARRQKEAA